MRKSLQSNKTDIREEICVEVADTLVAPQRVVSYLRLVTDTQALLRAFGGIKDEVGRRAGITL